MITKKDLKELEYLHQEIAYLQNKINNYKPIEIVKDSVKGSSAQFPYTEHTMVIEGFEQKTTAIDNYYNKIYNFKLKLQEEVKRIELELKKIEDSEIRQIIRYRYFDKMSWNQVADKLNIVSEDAARKKLDRYLNT